MRKLLSSILTLLMLSAVASQARSHQAKSTQTFASFWVQFKAAVATNDKEAVADMTKLPFYLEKQLTRAAFIKKYNEIFGPKIQRCFAKAKPVKDGDSYYSVFCGNEIYGFGKIEGKYKFIEIGAND